MHAQQLHAVGAGTAQEAQGQRPARLHLVARVVDRAGALPVRREARIGIVAGGELRSARSEAQTDSAALVQGRQQMGRSVRGRGMDSNHQSPAPQRTRASTALHPASCH
jgi:hypothetical protein